jgi:hypothetical protein
MLLAEVFHVEHSWFTRITMRINADYPLNRHGKPLSWAMTSLSPAYLANISHSGLTNHDR